MRASQPPETAIPPPTSALEPIPPPSCPLKRFGVSLLWGALAWLLFSGGVVWAQLPPDPNSPEEEQKRWRRVLFWKQRVKLLSLQKKESSLLATIESFDKKQLALMQRLQQLAQDKVTAKQELQKRLAAWKLQRQQSVQMLRQMQPRLRSFYRFVRLGRARLLMGARSLKTLALRWRALHLTTLQDLAMLRKYQSLREKAGMAAQRWKKKQKELDALALETQTNQRSLREQRREKALMLQALYKEVHVYRRVLKELRGSGKELRRLLKQWQKKAPSGGLSLLKGQLPWPIRGFSGRCLQYSLKISGSFRTLRCLKKSDALLSLKGKHQRPGATIVLPTGTPIRAVAAGRIAHLGWIRGYGQVILLDHGQHFYSLYAHLSSPLATLNQSVSAGHIVGLSGATGMLGQPVLYFELRHHARVLPTTQWLTPPTP